MTYQTQVLVDDVTTAIKNLNLLGVALWPFLDFKTNYNKDENDTHFVYIPKVYPPIGGFINADTNSQFGSPGGLS
jgi:hypothetical protein